MAYHPDRVGFVGSLRRSVPFDARKIVRAIGRFPRYWRDYRQTVHLLESQADRWPIAPNYPCLFDAGDSAGVVSGHYFHQDLHVARRVFQLSPRRHVDVGSRIDGFVAHVACFRPIEVFDIRPMSTTGNAPIEFRQVDLMLPRPDWVGQADSVSCLHVLEHFGLGRYGDTIDVDGYVKGLDNLKSLVEVGGRLHLSTPVGIQRIEFNAHRVFDPETILSLVQAEFDCVMFSFVDDKGDMHANVGVSEGVLSQVKRLRNGCGIFEFVKR